MATAINASPSNTSSPRTDKNHAGRLAPFLFIAAFTCLVGPLVPALKAQTFDPLEAIGVQPFSEQIPVERGWVSATNGGLHLEIPLGTLTQRGARKITVKLIYDSAMWSQQQVGWQPDHGGWHIVSTVDNGSTGFNYKEIICRLDQLTDYQTFNQFVWFETDGTQHIFPITVSHGFINKCGNFTSHNNPSGDAFAMDGSGYHMYVTAYGDGIKVYAPNGAQASAGTGCPSCTANLTDTNGNYVSYNSDSSNRYYVSSDTLGRTPFTVTINGDTTTVVIPKSTGGNSTYTITDAPFPVSTNFAASGSGLADYSGTLYMFQSVQLPDGSSYSFQYDSGTSLGHYGELTSMTLPTGGQIAYSYQNVVDSMYLLYGTNHKHLTRLLSTRTTPDGTWRYTPAVIVTCTGSANVNCQQSLTITKPSGDNAVYVTNINGGAWPIQAQYYSGAVSTANLIATVAQSFDYGGCLAGQCFVTKTAATATLPTPGGTNLNQTTEYCWDASRDGNLKNKWEWNFYTGTALAAPTNCTPPTTPDRTTTTAYLSDTNSNYLNKNIVNLAAATTVTDKSGSTVAQTLNCYDYAGSCGGSGFSLLNGVTHHDDTNFGTGNTVRGDLTQVQRLIGGTSNYLTTSMTYDTTGQMISSKDSSNNVTSYDYTDNFFNDVGDGSNPSPYTPPSPTNSYMHRITQGSLVSTFGYYWGTGQKALSTDPNSQTTYFHFYDPLNRSTSTKRPDGGWTYSVYPSGSETQVDTSNGITGTTLTMTCPVSSNICRHDQALLDGLGRISNKVLVSDPDGQSIGATRYDTNGRILSVSNPYRSTSDSTYGLETYTYDGLDRKIQVQRPDGSILRTYYGAGVTSGAGIGSELCSSSYGVGYPILRVDEAGNKLQYWTDGFGRVIEVDEPNSGGGLSTPTCYAYDLNNNLIGVLSAGATQSTCTISGVSYNRCYSYDLVSRLTSATNPESGSVNFYYTNSGGSLCSGDPNVFCRRTDARGITTTYSYDGLNRLIQKSYSDGTPTASYNYDQTVAWGQTLYNPLGRKTTESTSNSGGTITGSLFSYDPMGRAQVYKQCTPLNCSGSISPFAVNYGYDLLGDTTSVTNGGYGITFYYQYDAAGRPNLLTSSLSDPQHPGTLATIDPNIGYYPNGALRKITYGNGLTETAAYNNRLQPCRYNVNSSGSTLGACADAIPSANAQDFQYAFNLGTSDNGNIASFAAVGNKNFNRAYTYDPLNRLSAMTQSTGDPGACSNTFSLSWTYDRLGNRTDQTVVSGSCYAFHASVNTQNQLVDVVNHIYQYDAVGNLIADGSHSYAYDAENRLTQVDGTPGQCSTATACYVYDAEGHRVKKTVGTSDTHYIYALDANVIDEIGGNNVSNADYIYLSGQRVAEYRSSTTYFVHRDHLGSTRLVTGLSTPTTPVDNLDFLPFGEQISGDTITTHKFTGKERDSESGLDNFGARYNTSAMGRFTSPDPKLTSARLLDPQSLNRYSYSRNNPLLYVDPDGKDLDKAWNDIKVFAQSFYIKLAGCVCVEAKGKVGVFEGKVGAAAKVSAETSTSPEAPALKISRSADIGATAGPTTTNGLKVGEGVSAEQTMIKVYSIHSVDTRPEVPTLEITDTIGGHTTPNKPDDKVGIGVGLGYVFGAEGEIGNTREGISALKDSAKEIIGSLKNPGPPPAPPPPAPPSCIGTGDEKKCTP